MPGEFSGEVGREFVKKVCHFLDGKFGFDIYRIVYDGEHATSVFVGNEAIKFDFLMYQMRRETGSQTEDEYRVHFYCECKWRDNPADLRSHLRAFLQKALRTMPVIQTQCSDRYHFLFICNKHFGVTQEDITRVDFLGDFLGNDVNLDSIQDLSVKVGILIVPDWFLQIVSLGV